MTKDLEREYRLQEASAISGYKPSTLRKKIYNKELGSMKRGRIVTIPERELRRLIAEAEFRPAAQIAG
jgi:hypothetical protein